MKKLYDSNQKPKEVHITERGWAGHYVDCLYRRNTLLQSSDNISVVVITEGKRLVDGKIVKVGKGRYYQTYAYYAQDNEYRDIDTNCPLYFNSEWMIDHYNEISDLVADAMHEAVVAELMDKMSKGIVELYPTI